jgi:ABC-2 type transport system permease protein
MKDTPLGNRANEMMGSMTTLLGMLSQQFYQMLAVILPMIFIIITANSLIASQVDRGSMAYLLSTPTKRSTVVRTQAAYLITAVFCMFAVVTVVGLSTVQIAHKGLWGEKFTPDVTSASEILDVNKADLADNLSLILGDADALKAGADARKIGRDIYVVYLTQKMTNNAYEAAANILGKKTEDIEANLSLITGNDDALNAAAKMMGADAEAYRAQLEATIRQQSAMAEQTKEMQNKFMAGVTAASEVLGVDAVDLMSDMSKIKLNSAALSTAVNASALPEEIFLSVINAQLAADELFYDNGIDFNVKDYLMLNLGAFLLMFAISGISFLFSCVFNLSKNSLALGAGIPIAFFIFQIMAQIGDSLEGFKYISLNTLFDTAAVVNGGGYWLQFVVLAAVGIALYAIGMNSFQKKDLPL